MDRTRVERSGKIESLSARCRPLNVGPLCGFSRAKMFRRSLRQNRPQRFTSTPIGTRNIANKSGVRCSAEAALGDQASFAEIDCDTNSEFSKSVPVLNVPLVAYYHGGKMVAALIGADQNVRARMERVLRGEKIGYKDGTTPHNPTMKWTGAAGIVSRVRQLLRRGSGH